MTNGGVPAPGARDHQDRRRGKVRERAADGHVHEQQAQRRVLEARRRLQVVELARQQQRADRHRRRLGDERPEHRADGQDRQPPRRRRAATEAGHAAQRGLGKPDDGPRRGQRHDHDDKHRLGVVDRVVEVVRGGVPRPGAPPSPPAARWPRGRRRPRPRRQSAAAPPARLGCGPRPWRWRALVVPVLDVVGQRRKARRQERVQDGQHEDAGDHGVERIGVAPGPRAWRADRRRRPGRPQAGWERPGGRALDHRPNDIRPRRRDATGLDITTVCRIVCVTSYGSHASAP